MKRIVTLILAAGLILGATSAAQAVDFKVSGLWQHRVSFADRNFEKHNGDDKLRAASRLRTQIDVIASESLKGVMFFEIGHQNWGKSAQGAALGTDGKEVKVRYSYVDWVVPQTDVKVRMGLQKYTLPNFTGIGSPILDADGAGITISNQFTENVGTNLFWLRAANGTRFLRPGLTGPHEDGSPTAPVASHSSKPGAPPHTARTQDGSGFLAPGPSRVFLLYFSPAPRMISLTGREAVPTLLLFPCLAWMTIKPSSRKAMALSKLQKGLVGLGIAVVAVIAVGYGGMRYLENAVVDAIRTWAAQTPQDAHVELGDISYTLMDNHLVLKNVRMTYVTPAKQTVAATVETLDIRNPGTTLLSLMRDPKSEIKEAELPVADEIALHNLSFGPEPNITVRLRTFKGVAIETAAVKTLMSTAGDDDPKVALAIIYGLSYKEDSASGVKITSKALPFSLSTDSAVQKSYAKGHLESSVTNGIVFTLRGQDVLTLGEIRLENMNLPPRDIMEKIYFIAPTDINDDEAFGIFQNFFAGPKPLIGVFSLKDLKTSSALLDISLDKLNITNPSTSPYALEVSLEHLKIPVALVPELQLLSVMGVPEIDASASYAMSLPNKDNQFNSTASLSVAKLGTADFAVKGEFPYEEFLEIVNKTKSVDDPATEDAIENFVEKNIKFSHIEAGYADEGLLPRLGILGQKFMGLTPEQCVDMAKKYVKESLGAAEGTENTAKLMEYIDKPGAIRLIFNTEKPIPVEAFDTLSDTDPSIKLDVNTGPKTALELMADLEKK